MPANPDPSTERSTEPREDDLDAVFVWTAIRVGRRLERLVTDRLSDEGVTPMQFGVLAYLAAQPGMSQSDLARALHVRPQSARETITAMIDRGLLHRTGAEGRGRPASTQLTEDGHALLTRTWPIVDDIDATDVGLASREHDTANRLLHTVLRATESPG